MTKNNKKKYLKKISNLILKKFNLKKKKNFQKKKKKLKF